MARPVIVRGVPAAGVLGACLLAAACGGSARLSGGRASLAAGSTAGAVLTPVGLPIVHPTPVQPADPFTSPAVIRFLDSRSDSVTAAVYDQTTGEEFLYRPGVALQCASIIKVDILATLLDRAQQAHTTLTADEIADSTDMIEQSDNDDATELWDADDANVGVGAFDSAIGMRATTLNTQGYWGVSTTTAGDQITLLQQVVDPGGLLTAANRAYELGLMRHVESDQDWGVSAGVPAGVSVALKNGWVPIVDGDWEVNSIGDVSGDGRDYLVAVLTDGNPDEAYGIATIEGLSRQIYALVHPAAD